jgi:hypothetical protein
MMQVVLCGECSFWQGGVDTFGETGTVAWGRCQRLDAALLVQNKQICLPVVSLSDGCTKGEMRPKNPIRHKEQTIVPDANKEPAAWVRALAIMLESNYGELFMNRSGTSLDIGMTDKAAMFIERWMNDHQIRIVPDWPLVQGKKQ